MQWTVVAPTEPANSTDPTDPAYRWSSFDRKIALAAAYGLEPWLTVYTAPKWAQGGPPAERGTWYRPVLPSPEKLAAFARAAATRYSGTLPGLPRIRYWEGWIEPNASAYLMPQLTDGRPASPSWYRAMLNAFADAVKSVRSDNVVIGGGLTPFAADGDAYNAIAPLRFMRELFCLSADAQPSSTCDARVRFDVWGHHPYTEGGPTHSAGRPDEVSLGDLGTMKRVLGAAQALGKIASDRDVEFWVTEFSWDSDPPDTSGRAVPIALQARWVAEAAYRAWKAGVSLFAWHQLRDLPYPASPYQGGLYYANGSSLAGDTPKPALLAFRFPFVAVGSSREIDVWGRTPGSRPGTVVVEQLVGSTWRARVVLQTDAGGVFHAYLAGQLRRTLSAPAMTAFRGGGHAGYARKLPPLRSGFSTGDAAAAVRRLLELPRARFDNAPVSGEGPFLRARLADGSEASLPFSLAPVPDRQVSPFGG